MSACPWQWRLSSDSVALSGEPFDQKGVDFLGAGVGLEGVDEVVGDVFGEDETEALDFQWIAVLGDAESEGEGFAEGAGGEAGVGVGRAGEVFADTWVPPERR